MKKLLNAFLVFFVLIVLTGVLAVQSQTNAAEIPLLEWKRVLQNSGTR
jgi:hypothetical protein